MALAPLHRAFGVESVAVVTLQALSGAGYPGVASLDIADNVIPFIGGGEEEKIESEPQKILGRFEGGAFVPAPFPISASVHRVAVTDGHSMAVFVRLAKKASAAEAARALASSGASRRSASSPSPRASPSTCSPRRTARSRGSTATARAAWPSRVGRVREDRLFDLKLEALVHNTIRGAAGAAILNAELLQARGLLP